MNKITKTDYLKMISNLVTFEFPDLEEAYSEKAIELMIEKAQDKEHWKEEIIEREIMSSYNEGYELLYKLCEKLCQKFGTKIIVGKHNSIGRDVAGYYNYRNNEIWIKSYSFRDISWDVVAHELGHVITDKYDLLCLFDEDALLAEKFDPQKIRQEIMERYDAIQRHCLNPYIKAVENVHGTGAFEIILAHTMEHSELNWAQYKKNMKKADCILQKLEDCGYVDAIIEYCPIIKQHISLRNERLNSIIFDLFGAYFNLEYITHKGHSFSYYHKGGSLDVDELFANLLSKYFMDRPVYDEVKQYLPDTVQLFEKIMDLLFADLGIDKTQYRCDPPGMRDFGFSFYFPYIKPYLKDLELHGTSDDAPKVSCILQKHAYYKMLFRKNHRYAPYVKMYNFYHERLAPLIESGALSEKEFSKIVNNNFIVPFYECYKDSSFVKGLGDGEFLRLWKEFIPKKYVNNTRDLFSKTKYDLILVMFSSESTEKTRNQELKLVKKGQPDAEVRVGYWDYPINKEIMFVSQKVKEK